MLSIMYEDSLKSDIYNYMRARREPLPAAELFVACVQNDVEEKYNLTLAQFKKFLEEKCSREFVPVNNHGDENAQPKYTLRPGTLSLRKNRSHRKLQHNHQQQRAMTLPASPSSPEAANKHHFVPAKDGMRCLFLSLRRLTKQSRDGDVNWSDVRSLYKKETSRNLNGEELNLICGTKGVSKNELLKSNLSYLLSCDSKCNIVRLNAQSPSRSPATTSPLKEDLVAEALNGVKTVLSKYRSSPTPPANGTPGITATETRSSSRTILARRGDDAVFASPAKADHNGSGDAGDFNPYLNTSNYNNDTTTSSDNSELETEASAEFTFTNNELGAEINLGYVERTESVFTPSSAYRSAVGSPLSAAASSPLTTDFVSAVQTPTTPDFDRTNATATPIAEETMAVTEDKEKRDEKMDVLEEKPALVPEIQQAVTEKEKFETVVTLTTEEKEVEITYVQEEPNQASVHVLMEQTVQAVENKEEREGAVAAAAEKDLVEAESVKEVKEEQAYTVEVEIQQVATVKEEPVVTLTNDEPETFDDENVEKVMEELSKVEETSSPVSPVVSSPVFVDVSEEAEGDKHSSLNLQPASPVVSNKPEKESVVAVEILVTPPEPSAVEEEDEQENGLDDAEPVPDVSAEETSEPVMVMSTARIVMEDLTPVCVEKADQCDVPPAAKSPATESSDTVVTVVEQPAAVSVSTPAEDKLVPESSTQLEVQKVIVELLSPVCELPSTPLVVETGVDGVVQEAPIATVSECGEEKSKTKKKSKKGDKEECADRRVRVANPRRRAFPCCTVL